MKNIFLFAVVICISFGCKESARQSQEFRSKHISDVISQMTEIMLHDVTSPPLASRFFSYACLGGYEIVSQNDSSAQKMNGNLNDYPEIIRPDSIIGYSYQLAALLAMLEIAGKMQPSGKLLEKYTAEFLDSCKRNGFSDELIESSQEYASFVTKKILAYAKADGYNKISNLPRYTPVNQEGYWYPTPPGYMAAVEPYFNTVRPFVIDSCSQFKPEAPIPFSKDTNSAFYRMMMLNYTQNKNLTDDQRLIAAFWDCNPFALQDRGHLLVGLKKISPGAHWLGITGIACAKAKKNFNEAMQIHSMVSITLMDAFICCWDEKFRSNRVRPETAIRKYIDPSWEPFLQTPPFPEYLSGHSTISSASATVLTHYFGDNFRYRDTVEIKFGLPARSFNSFHQAADEAGLSRFYGGIHFMDAIDNGRIQGIKIGEWVIEKMKRG